MPSFLAYSRSSRNDFAPNSVGAWFLTHRVSAFRFPPLMYRIASCFVSATASAHASSNDTELTILSIALILRMLREIVFRISSRSFDIETSLSSPEFPEQFFRFCFRRLFP